MDLKYDPIKLELFEIINSLTLKILKLQGHKFNISKSVRAKKQLTLLYSTHILKGCEVRNRAQNDLNVLYLQAKQEAIWKVAICF